VMSLVEKESSKTILLEVETIVFFTCGIDNLKTLF